jgi:hypothetical protein
MRSGPFVIDTTRELVIPGEAVSASGSAGYEAKVMLVGVPRQAIFAYGHSESAL